MSFLSKVINTFWDFIYPRRCLRCRKDGTYFCPKCLILTDGAPKPKDDFVISVWSYKNPYIKKILWIIKYRGGFSAVNDLTPTAYDHLLGELIERKIMENFLDPILIPIPLSKKKLKQRGYNQSDKIAEALVKLDQNKNFILNKNILFKIKNTPNQAAIKNKKARLENLIGCFAVKNPELIKGRNIILLDDVATTGATLREARHTLRQSGAGKVMAITLAH